MDGKRKTGIAEFAFCCFIFLAGCAAGTAISTAFAPGQDIKTSAPEQLDREAYRRICTELGYVTQMSMTKFTEGMSLAELNLPDFYRGGQFTAEQDAEAADTVSLSDFKKPYLMVTVEAPGCGYCLDNRRGIRRVIESGADMDVVVLDIAAMDEDDARMRKDAFAQLCKEEGLTEEDCAMPEAVELVMTARQSGYVGSQMSLDSTPTTFVFGPDRKLIFRHEGSLSERKLPDGEGNPGNAKAYDKLWEIVREAGGKAPGEA